MLMLMAMLMTMMPSQVKQVSGQIVMVMVGVITKVRVRSNQIIIQMTLQEMLVKRK